MVPPTASPEADSRNRGMYHKYRTDGALVNPGKIMGIVYVVKIMFRTFYLMKSIKKLFAGTSEFREVVDADTLLIRILSQTAKKGISTTHTDIYKSLIYRQLSNT